MTVDGTAIRSLRAALQGRIDAHDKPGAVATALSAVERGAVSVPQLYAVVGALMADLGASWQSGATPVWQEHLVSGIARTIVEALYPTIRALADTAPRRGRTVVLACPQDESHDLGLRMLCDRFDLAGWNTRLLGADSPTGDIAAAAETLGADLIVLSASTHFHRMRVRTLLDELHSALPGVRVVVGGPAFTRDCCGLDEEEIMDPAEFFGDDAGKPEA
jgi:methanogenic corrinoid protein MtbC1